MIAAPPFEVGALQVTVACVFPPVAETLVGAPGGAAGVTGFEGADAALVPAELVAVTVNVYAVPLVSPETVVLVDDPLADAVRFPGDDVTV